MDFFDAIDARQSIRAFTSQKVEHEKITRLLTAIRTAPTAGNLQAYRVYVVETPDKIAALGRAAQNQSCVTGAPLVLVFCADGPRSAVEYGERGNSLYCLLDTTIAITIAHLTAVALGLGSVLVGAFNETEAGQIIDARPHERPLLMLPVGYPNETPAPTDRRPLDDLVVFR